MRQRFERALADFGLARIQLASAGDTLAVARVDANLGVLEVDRGHPAQALPHLDRAARDFEAMGAINELSTFRNMRVRSEEHTSELQSLMRISYAVFCLKKKNT